MSIGIGLLTHNIFQTKREDLFWRTWESLEEADQTVVLSNASDDGTDDVVTDLGGIVDHTNGEFWYGFERLVEELRGNDLIVLTADDMEFHEGWLERLVAFMDAAPRDIALVSQHMEPVWPWNQPREAITYGGQPAVIRDSVCGSAWTFRSDDWFDWLGPFPHICPGEDLHVCRKVWALGRRIAALDLTDHIGAERSSWGNESYRTARPFDREKWGLDVSKAEVTNP